MSEEKNSKDIPLESIIGKNAFVTAGFESAFLDYGLCLSAYRKGQYIASGTAVMIGPCIAITALHVIEEFLLRFDGLRFQEGKPQDQTGTFELGVINPKSGAIWSASQIFFTAERPDIAVLTLKHHNQPSRLRDSIFATINIDIPKVGDKIYGYGFVDINSLSEKNVDRLEFGSGDGRALRYSGGVIKEVHEQFRDTARLKFPCFHTNARFDGGMSGGPVFNAKGEVIGLVCSNLPPTNDDEEHVSYATLLWTAMLIQINSGLGHKGLTGKHPLLHFAQHGVINVKGHEHCFLQQDNSGNYVGVGFRV